MFHFQWNFILLNKVKHIKYFIIDYRLEIYKNYTKKNIINIYTNNVYEKNIKKLVNDKFNLFYLYFYFIIK